jgi:hypothetical protein
MRYETPTIERSQTVARMLLKCSPTDKIDEACVD